MSIIKDLLEMEPVLVLDLPMPPSVNDCYYNIPHGGRAKTKRYRTWIADCDAHILESGQRISPIIPPYAVIYYIDKPDKRKRDCANYEKPLSDYLVNRGMLEDDSKIEFNAQCWSGNKGKSVKCCIYSLAEYNDYT